MARLMARPLTAMLALSRAAAFLGPSPHKKPTVATPMLAEREEKWEPPEFEENRVKARKRQERFSPLDKQGAARRLMLDAQREMNERRRQRPAYLPLKPEASLENATAGQWFSGVVRNLKPHGAWVSIGAEVDGFVHCRDMSDTDFVGDSREVLRLGVAGVVGSVVTRKYCALSPHPDSHTLRFCFRAQNVVHILKTANVSGLSPA